MMKRVATVLGLALATAMLTALPALAQYPPAAGCVTVSATAVAPAETITVSSADPDCWLPGSTVTLTFFSTPVVLGTTTVNADGAWSDQVTIPAGATPGPHTLRASGFAQDGSARVVDIALTVLGAAAAPSTPGVAPGDGLAATGSTLTVGLLILVALLTVGGTTFVVGQRRRQRTKVSA